MMEVVEILSPPECEGFDPLTVNITWKNNKIPKDTEMYCITLFTFWDGSDWVLAKFQVDTTWYYWGSLIMAVAPSPGEEDFEVTTSYALNPQTTLQCGCLVILVEPAVAIEEFKIDLGKGTRTVGLNCDDIQNLLNVAQLYGYKHFENRFILRPARPPAEITSCVVEIS